MMNQTKKTRLTDIVFSPDVTIMERLQSAADSRGVHLTYTQNLFFLRLLRYAMKHGVPCREGLNVTLTVDEMVEVLEIKKRMVILSLRNLSDCGALLRYDGGTFPRSACETIIKREFFERSG